MRYELRTVSLGTADSRHSSRPVNNRCAGRFFCVLRALLKRDSGSALKFEIAFFNQLSHFNSNVLVPSTIQPSLLPDCCSLGSHKLPLLRAKFRRARARLLLLRNSQTFRQFVAPSSAVLGRRLWLNEARRKRNKLAATSRRKERSTLPQQLLQQVALVLVVVAAAAATAELYRLALTRFNLRL